MTNQDNQFSIDSLSNHPEHRCINIRWKDGHHSKFHYIWLRHTCFYPANAGDNPRDETFRIPDDPTKLFVTDIAVLINSVLIQWSNDGKTTCHDVQWLRRHCYSKAARTIRKHKLKNWDGITASHLRRFHFDDLESEDTIYDLLLQIRDYGLARIRNVPNTEKGIKQLAALFGPIRETNYGRIFHIRTDSDIEIAANKSSFLSPHTDENYRHAPPGISIFHCLEATCIGGESILVDGFLAAERLAKHKPAEFSLLTKHPIRFVGDSNDNGHMWASGRVICLDDDGDIIGIRYTDRTLPPLDLPEDLIEPMYRALGAFASEIYKPELSMRYMMRSGDTHIFDNQRVLHGRTCFDASTGTRHLQQCAVERDEFHYRLRLLAIQRNSDDSGLVMAGGALG